MDTQTEREIIIQTMISMGKMDRSQTTIIQLTNDTGDMDRTSYINPALRHLSMQRNQIAEAYAATKNENLILLFENTNTSIKQLLGL